MHRFHLPPEQCQGELLELSGSAAHHAARVLRLGPGAPVTVLDGAGQEIAAEIQECGRRSVRLRVLDRKRWPLPRWRVTLLQAIPKGKRFDLVIQKATELGASRIVPVLAERVIPQFGKAEAEDKVEKWRQIAVEAIKQCGSPWLPRLDAPRTVTQAAALAAKAELSLVGSLRPGSRHPRNYFHAFSNQHQRQPREVAVWIGPEGDFTEAEYDQLERAGARPITLGSLVLRTDTAALYCLSVLNYELQSPPEPGIEPILGSDSPGVRDA